MKTEHYILLLLSVIFVSCTAKQIYQEPEPDRSRELRARDHFTNGVFYEMENKHENALIEFYQALLYDSTSSTIYNRIAENHMALGRFESALRYLQKSQRIEPKEAETMRLIADCHYRLKDDDHAISTLKKVLELDPYDENSRSLLLLLYRKNNNFIGMAEQYEQMINIYGEDEDWVRKAAEIYLKNGQIEQALSLFEIYVQHDSTNASMWYSLGVAQELKDDSDAALKAYKMALQLAPQVAEAGERIYTICRKDQRWDELIQTFSPYTDTSYSVVYRLGVADAYLSKQDKELDKSEQLLLPILNEKEVPWQAFDLMGRVEWGRKNFGKAAAYFQEIIDRDPKNRIGWIFKGFVLSDADSLEAAAAHYQHALKYLPADQFLLNFYGITLQRLDRDEEAIVEFEKAITADSTYVNALVSYGISLNRLGQKDESIRTMERVLRLEPDNYSAFSLLGMLYDELKMYDKCDSLYERSLKYYPDNPLFLNNYAYSLSERGERLDYALELANKAVKAEPENSAYQDTIGWIYFMMGRYNLALVHIMRAVELSTESAVVIEHLGDVYQKLGDLPQAKSTWERALELDKDSERLKQKIENIRHEM